MLPLGFIHASNLVLHGLIQCLIRHDGGAVAITSYRPFYDSWGILLCALISAHARLVAQSPAFWSGNCRLATQWCNQQVCQIRRNCVRSGSIFAVIDYGVAPHVNRDSSGNALRCDVFYLDAAASLSEIQKKPRY